MARSVLDVMRAHAHSQVQTSKILFVDHSDNEWIAMWSRLEDEVGDTRDEDPNTGEVWQYMGTTSGPCGFVHQFRHRNHPVHQRRITANVKASKGWNPNADAPANHPVY